MDEPKPFKLRIAFASTIDPDEIVVSAIITGANAKAREVGANIVLEAAMKSMSGDLPVPEIDVVELSKETTTRRL